MNPIKNYLNASLGILQRVGEQEKEIAEAAAWFASTILAGRMVHVFGSGHSRIMVEEMWPRYGSFPGFNPIVELSLTYHNNVVGPNGQRQAMFLENVSGLSERILRNFALDVKDTALIISSSGTNIVPVEMAELFQQKGIRVVALITKAHSAESNSKRSDGKKLSDFADLILGLRSTGWRRNGTYRRPGHSCITRFNIGWCYDHQQHKSRIGEIAHRSWSASESAFSRM
jgi:uncharacterized phosphosugar-binding protein